MTMRQVSHMDASSDWDRLLWSFTWGCDHRSIAFMWGKEKASPVMPAGRAGSPDTHLLSPHGLKHLLQLDTKLLDVVHQDAGLEEDTTERG